MPVAVAPWLAPPLVDNGHPLWFSGSGSNSCYVRILSAAITSLIHVKQRHDKCPADLL